MIMAHDTKRFWSLSILIHRINGWKNNNAEISFQIPCFVIKIGWKGWEKNAIAKKVMDSIYW